MKHNRAGDGERTLAVFVDFENMGLGFNNRRDRFEIGKVLERLVEKGKIVCKKAYADWSRFGFYTGGLHEAAIELIEIPRRGMTGKNSADIRLVVDAIDLAYSKDHIDTFVIVSGDSDFSPLVSKLKELGKHVIGLGLADATSALLRDNCDEFIYYEDLDRAPIIPVEVNEDIPEIKRKGFALLLDSLLALRRENKDVIFSSMLKDTIKRKKPSFNEGYYGYRTFSELLEDAQREGLLELEKHRTSGMYVVSRFGLEMKSALLPPPVPRVVQLPQRNGGGEPRRVAELPPRNGGEPRRVAEPQQPVTLAEKRLVAPPAPVQTAVAEQRPAAPPPPLAPPRPIAEQRPAAPPPPLAPPRPIAVAPPKPPARPEADDREDDRPLGRALAEEFDPLDDDEVPSYAPRKVEAKPAARPATRAAAKPAAKEPAKRAPAAKPAAKAPATRAARPPKDAPPAKAPAEKPPAARKPEPKPAPKPAPPLSDDDEFGAGL